MSINDNGSFISRDNSRFSHQSPNNSGIYYRSSSHRSSNISSRSQKSYDRRPLNFQYDKRLSQQRTRNIIPKTTQPQMQANNSNIIPNISSQNLKYSIVKGDSNYIQKKKREFSRSNSRSKSDRKEMRNKSPQAKFMDWALESKLDKEINFDYSKPYKSPESFKYKNSNYNPLNVKAKVFNYITPKTPPQKQYIPSQPISLSNSKYFEGKKSDSLLMKLKENQIDNIDFNNLDLGKKKHLMHTSKLQQNSQNYAFTQNKFNKKKIGMR